jgi:hypothetical protein
MQRLKWPIVVVLLSCSAIHSAVPLEVRPSKSYTSSSTGVRLRISALPKKNGQIDAEQILIDSAGAKGTVVSRLNKTQQEQLSSVVALIKRKQADAAKEKFQGLVESLQREDAPSDLNELILYILRESFAEAHHDLMFYASRVKHFNEMKETMREYLKELREIRRKSTGGNCSQPVIGSVNGYIRVWEQKLATVGVDAQLADTDLQNALGKQQQLLQLLSNISKTLHDTAMGVIRNIR